MSKIWTEILQNLTYWKFASYIQLYSGLSFRV